MADQMIDNIDNRAGEAVRHYWSMRLQQRQKQIKGSKRDQGTRSAVTGGAQMDGFIRLFVDVIVEAGIPNSCIFFKKNLQLPGFFRPTKEWDLVVIKDDMLLAAIEAKSQVGPSFGNNFNNRTEEAMGSALDLWTAYREGIYLSSPQPFLGYFFMLEDCSSSNRPVSVREPHFKVLPEFVGASYMRRYELFCRKLVLERHYTAAAFMASTSDSGLEGRYTVPAGDLSLLRFAKSLSGHIIGGA